MANEIDTNLADQLKRFSFSTWACLVRSEFLVNRPPQVHVDGMIDVNQEFWLGMKDVDINLLRSNENVELSRLLLRFLVSESIVVLNELSLQLDWYELFARGCCAVRMIVGL